MKKTNTIIAFLLVLVAVVGCKKDTDPAAQEPEVSGVKVTPRQNGATFAWKVVDMPGKFQTCVELSRHENMSDLFGLPAYESEDKFVAYVDTLTANTTYYYRIVVWNKFKRFEKGGSPFTTSEAPSPGQDTTYYTISVSWQPEEGGTATGGGRFAEGDTCTVTATPNAGFIFVNWTEDGDPVSDSTEYSFEVTNHRDLMANFVEEGAVLYTVTTKAEPTNGGDVTGGGTYEAGSEIELRATPNLGYSFDHWQDGNTENPRTITVTADTTYTAYFTLDDYTIITNVTPEGAGAVTPGGTYHYGDTLTLQATPNSGFEFQGWNDGNTDNPRHITVTGDATYIAVFGEAGAVYYHVTIYAQPEESGEVSGGGTYVAGTEIELRAMANTGYYFDHWQDGNTANPRHITVNADMEFTAIFKKNTYTVTVSAGTGGTAHVGEMAGTIEATFEHGESCTVHAVAETGYEFVNWTENGIGVSTQADYGFVVTAPHNLVARFRQQTYTITVNADTGGTASGGGTGFHYGDMVTLTAEPADCYEFTGWSDGSTENPHTVTVTGTTTYTANFSPKEYTITVNAGIGGTAYVGNNTGTTSYTFACGVSCTVHASANEGYTFTSWTENGYVVSNEANYTFDVESARTLKANFAQLHYTITVSASPANGGTVQINNGTAGSTASGTFAYGTTIQLKATANSGYNFSQWNDGLAQTHNVMVTGVATYTATFTSQPQAPTGALPGKFTRNANGDKVYFSKGNLQYNKTTQVWSFMEHQYDIVETQGQNVGENYANQNIISLFGWGTSGYHDSNDPYNVNYQPWSTSTDSINGTYNWYGYGPSTNMPSPNLTGSSANYDWGYNAISNGGGQSGQWRTLTGWTDNNNTGEWYYIFFIRSASTVNGVANARYAKAKVANVQGVILFPDEYTHPGGVAQPVGINETGDAGWNGNDYSASDFASMQDAGAVFLPAAGYRHGTSVNGVGSHGGYWSASYSDSNYAHRVNFCDTYLNTSNYNGRYYGRSVRLVCPAE